jgi:hypothetical protein
VNASHAWVAFGRSAAAWSAGLDANCI